MEDKTSAIKFIKELKRKTRKRYNSEEKIAVVLAVPCPITKFTCPKSSVGT